jgi:hypothetical protein
MDSLEKIKNEMEVKSNFELEALIFGYRLLKLLFNPSFFYFQNAISCFLLFLLLEGPEAVLQTVFILFFVGIHFLGMTLFKFLIGRYFSLETEHQEVSLTLSVMQDVRDERKLK